MAPSLKTGFLSLSTPVSLETSFGKQIGQPSFRMATHLGSVVPNEYAQVDFMEKFHEIVAVGDISFFACNSLAEYPASQPIIPVRSRIEILMRQLCIAVNGYLRAKKLGVVTRIPVLPGLMSQLSELAKDSEDLFPDLLNKILPSYEEAVAKLKASGASCIQFDEPILVNNLGCQELQALTKAYSEMLPCLDGLDVLLETYNGNISPAVYKRLIALKSVTAIGIDLVHGGKNIELIKSTGFPSDKYLFAGVVDGRSISRDDLDASLNILHSLKGFVGKGKLVVSTSGPLIFARPDYVEDHVLGKDIESSWLEFAAQKVSEVKKVANLFSAGHQDEIMCCSFGEIQKRFDEDRESKIKFLEFDQRLLDTAAELDAFGDRLNIVEDQASRALGMHAGNNAQRKARKWLRCSCFK